LQLFQRHRINGAFYLYPVGARMGKARVGDLVLQFAVVGEQHQTFAIVIEPARRIDIWDGDVIGEGFLIAIAAELARHLERFIEEQAAPLKNFSISTS